MIASKEKPKISLESHMRVYTHFRGQCSEAKFRGTLKEVCEEVWWKLIINCLKTSADTRGSFQETSSKLPPAQRQVSRKFPRNFLAGVLTLGLLILTLGANFAHSGKPNFYIFTLRIDFEGKAKTGEVKIFSFGFEVNFLTCWVYWAGGFPDIVDCGFLSTLKKGSVHVLVRVDFASSYGDIECTHHNTARSGGVRPARC